MSDKGPKLRLIVSPERERASEPDAAGPATFGPGGGPGNRALDSSDLSGPTADSSEASRSLDDPFTEEELREAAQTRALLEAGNEPVSSSLRAAFQPATFDDADHEALLARALGDPLAAPTRVERAVAERLRHRLDPPASGAPVDGGAAPPAPAPSGAGDAAERSAELAGALRAAWRPPVLAPLRNEALIARALSGTRRRGRAREVVAAAVGLLALAAGLALIFRQTGATVPGRGDGAPAAVAMIAPRSTMDLFDVGTPFPRSGEETARIDRIAASRAADLRHNRYSQWGVR
ncbi:MAG: hypothetical protein WKG00_14860 [Polyangiaceae bacterium]